MIAFRSRILRSRLVDVMAVVAKPLPVVHAPEQHQVATMRDAVIDQGGQEGAAVAQLHAPGVDRQVCLRFLPPPMVIAALVR